VIVLANKLFIPGPVDVADDVAAKMAEPMVGHRSKEYAVLHKSCVEGLRKVLLTDNTVFIGPMSSSGWMEAAVRNCVGKKALHVVNGAFSQRWHKMSTSNGKEAEAVEISWGGAGKLEDVEDKVNSGEYDTLFVTHNETSTGAMMSLEGFGKLCSDNDVLLCVDAVSSAAGVKIETDKLGIDVLVTGTQKCFAVAPGLAMCAVSDRALERSKTVKNRGLYLDYQDFLKKAEKDNTPSTPPIPQIRALDYQCGKILKEGLDKRFKRHARMAKYTQGWVRSNWDLFCDDWCLSDTVTCVENTKGFDLADLGKKLGERGYQFANGYGKLKGEAFRVPHMGDRSLDDLKAYLEAVDDIVGL
jgi:aspartate aminotransferase-like enzyme